MPLDRFIELNHVCQGRLTLTSGSPVTTSNTSSGILYFTPYLGNKSAFYSGQAWYLRTFSETSISLVTTNNSNYDVFLHDSGGVISLVLGTVWTNATTRANALVLKDGINVNNVAEGSMAVNQGRYLGTIRASSTNLVEDSVTKRFLWNYYNRVTRKLKAQETTATWTYTTASFREINGGSTFGLGRVGVVIGWSEDLVELFQKHVGWNLVATIVITTGIGVDSTTASSADTQVGVGMVGSNYTLVTAQYYGYPGIGYHTFHALERSQASGTTNWRGLDTTFALQPGLNGVVLA